MTTTVKTTVRDKLNSNVLGKESDALAKAPLGDLLSVLFGAPATVPAATAAAVTATDATNPANAAYTQADQTALAALANSLKTQLNALITDVAALRTAVSAINKHATEVGVTVTTNVATLAALPSTVINVNATAGTTTGVKTLVRDPAHTLVAGEVYWDGKLTLTFAAADAVTACDVVYSKADNSQKISCLMAGALP